MSMGQVWTAKEIYRQVMEMADDTARAAEDRLLAIIEDVDEGEIGYGDAVGLLKQAMDRRPA